MDALQSRVLQIVMKLNRSITSKENLEICLSVGWSVCPSVFLSSCLCRIVRLYLEAELL